VILILPIFTIFYDSILFKDNNISMNKASMNEEQIKSYPLNTQWCLWYHSINDTSWDKKSYKDLYTIRDLYGLKAMNDTILPHHLQNGMFFIMREDIFPTWEDPENRNGSCLSFKISGSILKEQWNYIVERILTEDILIDKNKSNCINGLSIAPKKEFNILKIWFRDYDEDYSEYIKEYSPYFQHNRALLKKHDL